MNDFRNLKVWELSHKVVLMIYNVTGSFPKEETYGLVSQIRRACTSIPTNISEGCGRDSDADFKRFLQIAFGSSCELEYLLFLSSELKLVSDKDFELLSPKVVEIKKMLIGLIKKLKEKS